jgi:hypothetical protein
MLLAAFDFTASLFDDLVRGTSLDKGEFTECRSLIDVGSSWFCFFVDELRF